MEKYVKWRDSSFKMSQDPERWVPEAKAAAYEMVKSCSERMEYS